MEMHDRIKENIDFTLFVFGYVFLLISFFLRNSVLLPVFLGIASLFFLSALFIQFYGFTPRKRLESLVCIFLFLLMGLPFTYLYFEADLFSVESNIVSLILSVVFVGSFISLTILLSRFISGKLVDKYNLLEYFDFE